jgi:ribosomal protein S18 acetylase RimI-like enzyme
MNLSFSKRQTHLTQISHNLDYPVSHLEEVLLPLFAKSHSNDSLRVTIESANHIWCAYENGKCIGCVLITDIGSHGGLYIILFGVRKSAQGRGIGTYLLENIIKWSRKHRHTFIYLHTEEGNKNAIGLYEKAGFRKDFDRPVYMEQLPTHGSGVVPMMLVLI